LALQRPFFHFKKKLLGLSIASISKKLNEQRFMKILALDLGDRWVGSAISDPVGITCRPYQTVELAMLPKFLKQTLQQERIQTVIVGYPKTFSGGQSEQTMRIVKMKENLEQQFGVVDDRTITWLLWDERLSSKRADQLHRRATSPEEKKKSHSVAAAFILQTYLDHLALMKEPEF
jgi:putative holliday junction resolvase